MQAGIVYPSFKTKVDDNEWSVSRRVDYLLMHSQHDSILPTGIVYPSFKTKVNDIEWSDSSKVRKNET